MGKARLLGMKTTYIPNSKADMRHRKKIYQRNREVEQRAQIAAWDRMERREKGESVAGEY